MARMHSRKKGRSGSNRPITKITPSWIGYSAEEVVAIVEKLAKEGKTPAQIGQILRDDYGIPLAKLVAGKTVSQILKEKNILPAFPTDLIDLIRKAVNVREHMQAHKKDIHNRTRLTRVESKIRRLVDYYRSTSRIPRDWRYEPEKAALLVK